MLFQGIFLSGVNLRRKQGQGEKKKNLHTRNPSPTTVERGPVGWGSVVNGMIELSSQTSRFRVFAIFPANVLNPSNPQYL